MLLYEPRLQVIENELNPDTLQHYQAEYGVAFVLPTADQERDIQRAIVTLLDQGSASSLAESVLFAPSPPVFLQSQLTAAQVERINEAETAAVADFCLGVQADIAAVPIKESGERMVHLPDLLNQAGVAVSLSELPFHEACGDWAGQPRQFWVRESVGERLVVFTQLLQKLGLQLHIEDAFRPVGVQEGLFKRRVGWTRADHKDWTDEQIIREARSKTAVTPKLASHKAGAALDATLRIADGATPLDFGHNYPDGGALVFPRTPFVTFEQWRNRQIYQVAAGLAGLALYVGEDWHVSFGDNSAGIDPQGRPKPGYIAQYGPIKSFDQTTGEIQEVYTAEEMETVFDI